MSLMRALREFGRWQPPMPVWRQLLGIFFFQLLGLLLLGGGLLLQRRGVGAVTYAVPNQPPRPTGGPWLLYLLGAGLMLLTLSYTLQSFKAWRRQRQTTQARLARHRKPR